MVTFSWDTLWLLTVRSVYVCREHRRVWLLAVSSLYRWRRLLSATMCVSWWIHANSVRDQVCQTWRYVQCKP